MNNHHITRLLASERIADLHGEAQPYREPMACREIAHTNSTLERIVSKLLRRSSVRTAAPTRADNNVAPLSERPHVDGRSLRQPTAGAHVAEPIRARGVARSHVYLPITARDVARLDDYRGTRGQ